MYFIPFGKDGINDFQVRQGKGLVSISLTKDLVLGATKRGSVGSSMHPIACKIQYENGCFSKFTPEYFYYQYCQPTNTYSSSSKIKANIPEPIIVVYPNPNNGSFVFETNLNEKCNLRIYNNLGLLVYELNLDCKSDPKVNINLYHLSKGIYNLKCSNGNFIKLLKITIE